MASEEREGGRQGGREKEKERRRQRERGRLGEREEGLFFLFCRNGYLT